jgi:hypothetical protein
MEGQGTASCGRLALNVFNLLRQEVRLFYVYRIQSRMPEHDQKTPARFF